MNKYINETNQVPLIADVDVLVCGGGPAGLGASICAARQGVSVMVVEAQGCLGGIHRIDNGMIHIHRGMREKIFLAQACGNG